MSLLDQCERYEPDDDEMKELFEAERDVNAEEATTVQSRAASWVSFFIFSCNFLISGLDFIRKS
jgi:hypothetical protein